MGTPEYVDASSVEVSERPQNAYMSRNPVMKPPLPGTGARPADVSTFADRAPKCHRGRKDESHD